MLSHVQHERTSLKQKGKHLNTKKESYKDIKQMYPNDRKEADMLPRKTSKSYNSLLVESQHEILMLKNVLKTRDQLILSNFTLTISVLPASGNRSKFEVSLEAPCVSNLVAKITLGHHLDHDRNQLVPTNLEPS